jgi:hypothetical protein
VINFVSATEQTLVVNRRDINQVPRQNVVRLDADSVINPGMAQLLSEAETLSNPLKELLDQIKKEIKNLYKDMGLGFGEVKMGKSPGKGRFNRSGSQLYPEHLH